MSSRFEATSDGLLKYLKQCPINLFISVAGGGYSIVNEMVGGGGLSSIFVGSYSISSRNFMKKFLGEEPEKYCSVETAQAMANKGFELCQELSDPLDQDKDTISLAVTASLRTVGEREGRKHKACFCAKYEKAFNGVKKISYYSLPTVNFSPKVINYAGISQAYWRDDQEKTISKIALNILAEITGYNKRLNLYLLTTTWDGPTPNFIEQSLSNNHKEMNINPWLSAEEYD